MFDLVISIVTYHSNIDELKFIVDKILSEKRIKIKLIITDNCSKQIYFNELVKLDCIVISSGKNQGYGKANNKAFLISPPHKYLLILNPDIKLEKETLFNLFNFMEKNKDISLVSPLLKNNGYYYDIERNKISLFELMFRFLNKKTDYLKKKDINKFFKNKDHFIVKNISGSFMFIRNEIFKKLNGFNPIFFMYFEDIELCDRVNKIGKIAITNLSESTHIRQRHSYKNIFYLIIHFTSYLKYKFATNKN